MYGVISTGGKLLAISDDLDHINSFVVKNKKFISGIVKVLEYSDLSDKKKKHIEKAILILEDEIDSEEAPTIDTMEDLLSMETDYQEKII